MDNIIKQLVEIEDEAQKISNEALEEKLKLQKRIDDAIKTITSEIEAETLKTIDEVKNSEISIANIRLKEIDTANKKQLQRMEEEYSNHHEKWENELFNNIVRR